jgi:putative DNA primase/helicase
MLDSMVALFAKYMDLPSKSAGDAIALWCVHAHAFDCFDISPRLLIRSAVKRSGKTRLAAIIAALTPKALLASNVSAAVIYRVIQLAQPTLIADEADAWLSSDEALRSVINSSHTRASAHVLRCDGDNNVPRRFSTWAPIVISGIGTAPETIEDRSVIIELQRRAPGVARLPRLPFNKMDEFKMLSRHAARWAADHLDELSEADPDVPANLNDRAADNWLPLLAIAYLAGGDWRSRARDAALELSADGAQEDESTIGIALLTDIKQVFVERQVAQIKSEDLLDELNKRDDRPWPEFSKGDKPMTASGLAKILKPFKIKPSTLRFGKGPKDTGKGYKLKHFNDAFARYTVDRAVTPSQSAENCGFGGGSEPSQASPCDGSDCANFPQNSAPCDGVTAGEPGTTWKVAL